MNYSAFMREDCQFLFDSLEICRITDKLRFIGLYGSANYCRFDNLNDHPCSDYDLVIVLKKGSSKGIQEFIEKIFGFGNEFCLNQETNCIFYDRVNKVISDEKKVFSMMLFGEDIYDWVIEKSRSDISLSIPWLRMKQRPRPAKVPLKSFYGDYLTFDMHERFDADNGFWKLELPFQVVNENIYFPGTFFEISLTADFCFGDELFFKEQKRRLLLKLLDHLAETSSWFAEDPLEKIFNLFVVKEKSNGDFKRYLLRDFQTCLNLPLENSK